jgi:hypothetical protein
MPAAGVVLLVTVVLIVLALVYYLVSTILALRQITAGLDEAMASVGEIIEKTAPVNGVVDDINEHLDAAVDALEGLLVKKAGIDSATTTPPRIAEVYTRGTLTLARLGREAPIAAASPDGPVLRDVNTGSLAARELYPEGRQARAGKLPRSPVIGTDAPVQYEPTDEPGVRKRMPA